MNYIMYNGNLYHSDELMHYGVKGMKWGHRKARSQEYTNMREKKAAYKQANKDYNRAYNKAHNYSARHQITQWGRNKQKANANWEDAVNKSKAADKAKKEYKQAKKEYKNTDEYKERRKKAIKTGVAVAGTALAAYGAYKVSKYIRDENVTIRMMEGRDIARKYEAQRFAETGVNAYGGYKPTSGMSKKVYDAIKKETNDYSRKTIDTYEKIGKNDSLITATKNVYNDYKKRRG